MKTEKDIEEILDNVKIPSDEEVEAAGMRFDRRIRRLRMRRRVMWAPGSVAAVLCCGVVFASLWMNRGVKENLGVSEIPRVLTTDHQVAVPTLILADGNKLNLKEREIDSTIGKSNIRITDDRVIYDTIPAVREIVYNRLIIPTGFTYNVTLADAGCSLFSRGQIGYSFRDKCRWFEDPGLWHPFQRERTSSKGHRNRFDRGEDRF